MSTLQPLRPGQSLEVAIDRRIGSGKMAADEAEVVKFIFEWRRHNPQAMPRTSGGLDGKPLTFNPDAQAMLDAATSHGLSVDLDRYEDHYHNATNVMQMVNALDGPNGATYLRRLQAVPK